MMLYPETLKFPEKEFTFRDEPGKHDPCYIVMPDGACLPVNHWNDETTDVARAEWIVAACNTFAEEQWAVVKLAEARSEVAKLGEAFDAQTLELETAVALLEELGAEHALEYRRRAYPTLYPRP